MNRGGPQIEECSISASEASSRNVGVESNGGATLARCEVTATGGVTAIAMSIVGNVGIGAGGASSEVSDSKLVAEEPPRKTRVTLAGGPSGRYGNGSRWTSAAREAPPVSRCRSRSRSARAPSTTSMFWSLAAPPTSACTSRVDITTGFHGGVRQQVLSATIGGPSYGIRLGGGAPESGGSPSFGRRISGSSAALFSDAPFNEWGTGGVRPPLTMLHH